MQFLLHNFFTLCITLILTVESLRHHHENYILHDNESGIMKNSELINENNHHEDMDSNDSKHAHNGLARWGEENPYQADADESTEVDDKKHTTSEAQYNGEQEGDKEKDKETESAENYSEQASTQQAVNKSLDHEHEGLANWGNRPTEYHDDVVTMIINGTNESTQESDDSKTTFNEAHKHENTTNHSSIWSNPIQINQSSPHDPENLKHDHHYNQNNENSTDSSNDSHIIDHLVDPLLSNMYVANNQSSVGTQTDNDTDDLKGEKLCRKCVKWQKLQLTLPCLLYPINFDAPENVNQTKIIYLHIMRKVVARINRSLNELLLDMELY
ncbi:hypothetical protein MN116_002197 [Schistosoma mekongi]|uniref:Uncharacterized protein n=1 Tax=Schistosoma mekongi TaxID=38744 RepID=A0AAE1ZK43_SCHME|nr:hypothetical protein MN116_002197 [Schistosoma mekongi]